jgi:hypothetical protein
MAEIKVQAFTIESTEIETDEVEYRAARDDPDDGLALAYDAFLSDMDSATVVIDPDTGEAVNPYGEPEDPPDLMELLRPILAHVPAWRIDQYAAGRRAEEE